MKTGAPATIEEAPYCQVEVDQGGRSFEQLLDLHRCLRLSIAGPLLIAFEVFTGRNVHGGTFKNGLRCSNVDMPIRFVACLT